MKPLVTDDEFRVTEGIVKKFGTMTGIGPALQKKLQERASATDNWVS